MYLFQIKEYRFDRFYSLVNEVGLHTLLYSLHIRYPSKSLRNILIFLFLIFILGFLLLIAIEISFIYYFLTFVLPVSPILSLLIVSIGVILTKFPAYLQREFTILRAKNKVKKSKTIFIGITGTFGKSSVKEFIYALLSSEFKTAKTDANQNTDVGIALSILRNLKKDTQYFVTEFGAYRMGEIKKASEYIPLKYAVLTGLGNQHIDLYGSKENLIKEETYLLYTIPSDGTVFIKFDIPEKHRIIKHIKAKKIFYGFESNADIKAFPISSDPFLQNARIEYKDKDFSIYTRLLGQHTIANFLPAIALALELGIPEKKIIATIESLPQIHGKLSLHHGKKKALVINDAVNSNVEGFISAIHTLNSFPQKNKMIISQGIIELGVEKRSSYEKIAQELKKTNIILFTTDSLFKEYLSESEVNTFNDVKNLQQSVLNSINKHSIILLEGKFPHSFIESIIN